MKIHSNFIIFIKFICIIITNLFLPLTIIKNLFHPKLTSKLIIQTQNKNYITFHHIEVHQKSHFQKYHLSKQKYFHKKTSLSSLFRRILVSIIYPHYYKQAKIKKYENNHTHHPSNLISSFMNAYYPRP